jgi:HAD superfamily hydrolase (TIGR01662 family)
MLSQLRPTAVIFDWGNTLCDYPLRTKPEQLSFLAEFLRNSLQFPVQLKPAVLEEFNSERSDSRVSPFTERIRQRLVTDIDDLHAAALEEQICARIWAVGSIVELAAELVQSIKAAGLKIAILSNTPWGTSPRLWRGEVQRHSAISRYCDAIMFCGDCGYRKPHPAAFIASLKRLNASPDSTVVIGDNYCSDIIGARRTGCYSILVGKHAKFEPDAVSCAVSELSDLIALFDRGY